jgi:hypothetical protein
MSARRACDVSLEQSRNPWFLHRMEAPGAPGQPDSPLEKDGEPFKNGREFAAWLGRVPRQHTTGGKPLVLGISQRGERYLRQWHIPRARQSSGQWRPAGWAEHAAHGSLLHTWP